MIPAAYLRLHAALLPDPAGFFELLAVVPQQRALALYPLDFLGAITHLTANILTPAPLLDAVRAAEASRTVVNEFYDRLTVRNGELAARWETSLKDVYGSVECSAFASRAAMLLRQTGTPQYGARSTRKWLLELGERLRDAYWLAENWGDLLSENQLAVSQATPGSSAARFIMAFEQVAEILNGDELTDALRAVQVAPPRYER